MSTISDAIHYPALITHLTGLSNYSWLHFCDGKKELIAKPLRFFEEKLPTFVRVHKTALVNPYYIQDYKPPLRSKMAGSIYLRGGTELPVGRRRWSQIVELLPHIASEVPVFPEDDLPSPPVSKPVESAQEAKQDQVFVVMTNELRMLLLRQLVEQKWPRWNLQFFDNALALKTRLSTLAEQELPALILLEGGTDTGDALAVLQFIKRSSALGLIPTLLTVPVGNRDLIDRGHLAGANSVIPQPSEPHDFLQTFEKVFRYWLFMVAAPRTAAL